MGQSIAQPTRTASIVYIATTVNDEFFISCGGSIIGKRLKLPKFESEYIILCGSAQVPQ
jgi:hypothetical protein